MAKKLTCKDLGGPCDFEMTGETVDEIVGKGAMHIKEMAESGDEAHKSAKEMMDNSPEAEKGEWFQAFQETFNNAPDA